MNSTDDLYARINELEDDVATNTVITRKQDAEIKMLRKALDRAKKDGLSFGAELSVNQALAATKHHEKPEINGETD